MLDKKSSEWFKKSSELMHKTVTYTKKENQGIKLRERINLRERILEGNNKYDIIYIYYMIQIY